MSDLLAFAIAAFIVGTVVALYHTRLVRKYHSEVTAVKALLEEAENKAHYLRTRLTSVENSAARIASRVETMATDDLHRLFVQTGALAESIKILGGLK